MATFRFYDPKSDTGEIFSLTATTNINISSPATVTSSPVEAGSRVADNYFKGNKVVTFSGVISSVGLSHMVGKMDPTAWLAAVEAVRDKKHMFTVVADTEVISNTVMTQLSVTKTVVEGLSAWKCNVVFQQLNVVERANLVTVEAPKAEEVDKVEVKKKTSSTNTKQVPLAVVSTIHAVKALGG